MVSDSVLPSTADGSVGSSNTAVNGLLGGVVGVVLGFLPFSTLLGGAVAGYLDADSPDPGLRAGAVAGLVMFVPFAVVLGVVLFLIGFGAPSAFGFVGLVVLVGGGLYTVGLGTLGGFLGAYLRTEL